MISRLLHSIPASLVHLIVLASVSGKVLGLLPSKTSKMTSSVSHKVIGTAQLHTTYSQRHAVRTIVEDPTTRKIALIFVQKGQYYKLPGGGIEVDEDHTFAAEREALEEIGCKVKVDMNGFRASTG